MVQEMPSSCISLYIQWSITDPDPIYPECSVNPDACNVWDPIKICNYKVIKVILLASVLIETEVSRLSDGPLYR